MPTVRDELRRFALSLPGAVEDFPWDDPVAKVDGKIFAFLGSDRPDAGPLLTVKLDESHGHAMSVEGARPTGYGLGRAGWVTVPLDAGGLDVEVLCDWVEESYRIVAPKRLIAELDRRAAG